MSRGFLLSLSGEMVIYWAIWASWAEGSGEFPALSCFNSPTAMLELLGGYSTLFMRNYRNSCRFSVWGGMGTAVADFSAEVVIDLFGASHHK